MQFFRHQLTLQKTADCFRFEEVSPVYNSHTGNQNARKLWEFQPEGEIELRECFFIMLLNKANCPIGWVKISEGGYAGTVVDLKQLFSTAILSGASAIILVHNHPSGNLKPSQADIDLTRRIVSGGKILDISVLDHLIITEAGYMSFADEGLI